MNALQFQHANFALIGLIGLFFWLISYFYVFKKPQIHIPKKYKKIGFPFIRSIVLIIGITGWIFITYALMGPRRPMGMDKNTIEVNDIFIVLDLSRSMLAEDFKPNRVEAAKQKIHELVNMHTQDRIGVVIFAEKVFTLLPLSTDFNLIGKMIDGIKLGPLGDGTNIGDALALATGRLIQSQAKNKVIILLTDGVSNVGALTPIQAAEMAQENKIKIYCIGIGSDKDARIPVGNPMFGIQRYQTIPGGSVDEKGLREISKLTGAKAFMASDEKALSGVLQEINKLERTQIEHSGKIIYQELYFKYLLIGVCLLLLGEILRKFVVREGQ